MDSLRNCARRDPPSVALRSHSARARQRSYRSMPRWPCWRRLPPSPRKRNRASGRSLDPSPRWRFLRLHASARGDELLVHVKQVAPGNLFGERPDGYPFLESARRVDLASHAHRQDHWTAAVGKQRHGDPEYTTLEPRGDPGAWRSGLARTN